MGIRHALAMVVALVVSEHLPWLEQAPKKDDRKRSKQEQQEIEQVVKLVDGVMAGQRADRYHHVGRALLHEVAGSTHVVPFVLTVNNAPAARPLHIRVANRAAAPDPKAKKVDTPGTTLSSRRRRSPRRCTACSWRRPAHTTPPPSPTRSRRRKRTRRRASCRKWAVPKTQITVPDYYNGEEPNTSAILVAEKVSMLSAPVSMEEARERPFVSACRSSCPQ